MAPQKKHGMCNSKEYRCWRSLKNRCLNPKNAQYKDYGGRGITICERWLDFINFFADMGKSPNKSEIDRIDNNSGYFKENCRWTTKKKNASNRRSNVCLKVKDELIIQKELIEKIGWSKDQFRWFKKKNGISWILDGYKNNTLPKKTNIPLDRHEIEGMTFGNWLVIRFVEYIKSSGNIYLCKCKCGREKLVIGYHLRSGKSKQCHSCSYKSQINKPHNKVSS